MAAAGMAHALATECREIQERCRSFNGVRHRIEWVLNAGGVDYYNDSKATNLDSMDTALASFQRPVVLIAGGRPKGEEYTHLRAAIREKVKALILLGEAAEWMDRAWSDCAPVHRVNDFTEAVAAARRVAQAGDVVLLSPGCTSFDMFRDYEDRGDQFRATVHEMLGSGDQAS
jgi:UDP-N-acetylmuramoylalanine--D-glutamate ligase